MAESKISAFNLHAQAFQKPTSRAGATIEKQEANVLARLYAELAPKEQREVRRSAKDSPELTRVLGDIDPKMTNQL